MIANILVLLQAEKQLSDNYHASTVQKQQSHVSKLASSLPAFTNTTIPKDMMINHPPSWQTYLERISDFLLVGRGVWWDRHENGDVHFFDAKGNPESLEAGSGLHHFRSCSFKSEESYSKESWLKCLDLKCYLPIFRLQIENEDGNMVTVPRDGSALACDGKVNERYWVVIW